MKDLIMFGAGASYGHLQGEPTPALGNKLFEELVKYSEKDVLTEQNHEPLKKILTQEEFEEFEKNKNFESGMKMLIDRHKRERSNASITHDLDHFHHLLAGYFSQFQLVPGKDKKSLEASLYAKFGRTILQTPHILNKILLISLNYELILEQHLFYADLYKGGPGIHSDHMFESFNLANTVTGEMPYTVKVLKPHGSINFYSGLEGVARSLAEDENVPITHSELCARSYRSLGAHEVINPTIASYAEGKTFIEFQENFDRLRKEILNLAGNLESVSFIGVRLHEGNVESDPFLNQFLGALSTSCAVNYIGDLISASYLEQRLKRKINHIDEIWKEEHNSILLS